MPSPRSKRTQLIETARALFFAHGSRRVTVEEVCRRAGVSKVTFYKYFRNKQDMVRTIIEGMSAEALEQYRSIMEQPVPFAEKAKQLVEMKMRQTEGLSQEFMRDLLESGDRETAALCRRMIDERFEMIARDFVEAQRNGDIRADIKPQFLLFMLHQLLALARDERLSSLYPSTQALSVELTNFFFYGIVSRRENAV